MNREKEIKEKITIYDIFEFIGDILALIISFILIFTIIVGIIKLIIWIWTV